MIPNEKTVPTIGTNTTIQAVVKIPDDIIISSTPVIFNHDSSLTLIEKVSGNY
jgi:hypothetical protein